MPTLLVKNKQEILDILKWVIQCMGITPDGSLENLKQEILNLKTMAIGDQLTPAHFLNLGAMTLKLIDKFRAEHNIELFDPHAFADFLWNKHQKYGAEPLIEVGTIGIIMRLISKVNRIINMQILDNTTYSTDDEDTLMDILGYCALGYQLIRTTNDKTN